MRREIFCRYLYIMCVFKIYIFKFNKIVFKTSFKEKSGRWRLREIDRTRERDKRDWEMSEREKTERERERERES